MLYMISYIVKVLILKFNISIPYLLSLWVIISAMYFSMLSSLRLI